MSYFYSMSSDRTYKMGKPELNKKKAISLLSYNETVDMDIAIDLSSIENVSFEMFKLIKKILYN